MTCVAAAAGGHRCDFTGPGQTGINQDPQTGGRRRPMETPDMTHYGGRELAAAFRTVRHNTTLIAEEIPEESYNVKAADTCRTVAQTLAHIATAPEVFLHAHKQQFDDVRKVDFMALAGAAGAEAATLATKADIVAALKSHGEKVAAYLEGLSPEFLAERVTMPPGASPSTKSRLEMLLSVKEHEMHHRGQLMMLQRIIGLTPHLTRQMQERFAQRQAAATTAGR